MIPALQPLPRLAPLQRAALLRFMSLLPVGAADLEALVSRAVDDNPVLERLPARWCGVCGAFCRSDRCTACSGATVAAEPVEEEDWRAELLLQARLELPRTLHPLLDCVIGCLDDRGLLTGPMPFTPSDLQAVVAAVRAVGPPGIAAGSPTECLRLQVAALAATGHGPAVLPALVEDWLPQIAEGRYAEIAAALGVTEGVVAEAVDYLTAHTRPFVGLTDRGPREAPVDVVFSVTDRDAPELAARVVESEGWGIRVADDFDGLGAEAQAWLAPHREAAERLLAAIDARAQMLSRVADVLAVRQQAFILQGPARHLPLRRAEVAAELSVHPSTVGRAVGGKVARCPDGRLVPLPEFFGTGPSTRVRIRAAILAQPGATDAEVAADLARRGTPVARRTVSKYRCLLRRQGELAKHPSPPV